MYGEQNVAISGIHTHSGPAGYLQYLLYDITSLGFVRESFDALVDGIVLVPLTLARLLFAHMPQHVLVQEGLPSIRSCMPCVAGNCAQ